MIQRLFHSFGKDSTRKFKRFCLINEAYQRHSRNMHKSASSLTINSERNERTTRRRFIRSQQNTRNPFNQSGKNTTIETIRIDTGHSIESNKKSRTTASINQTTSRKDTTIKTTLNLKIEPFQTTDT